MSRSVTLRFAAFAALCAALAGCTATTSIQDPVRYGPFYAPRNIQRDPQLPSYLRRVLLLPSAMGDRSLAEAGNVLDDALADSLQRQARFEVVPLSRTECLRRYGVEEFSSVAPLPHKFLERVAADFAVDAVIFVDVTSYRAYRPLALGLRAKLATTETTRVVWAFDELISAADPAVANSARQFFLTMDRATVPVDLSHEALQSPSRFAAYASDAMFKTLPPR